MEVALDIATLIAALAIWLYGCTLVKEWATVPFCSDARIVIAIAWMVSPIFVIGYVVG